MAIVGTAYVIVRAISDKVGQEIKQGVEKGAQDAAPSATRAGERIGESIGRGVGDKIKDELPRATEPAADDAGARTGRRFSLSFGNAIRAGFRSLGGGIDKFFEPDPERKGQSMAERFVAGFRKVRIPTLPLVAILGLPALAQAVNAVALYATSLVSIVGAIGPALAGGAGIALSGVTALAQGMVVLKLALAGTGPAMDALKKSATDFKTSIVEAVSGNALPGFQAALNTIAGSLLPTLRTQLGATGAVLGSIATGFANMISSAANVSRINTLLAGNNTVIANLGEAVTSLASAFLAIAVAAQPLVIRFSEFITRSAQLAASFIAVKAETGELAAFFVSTGDSLKQLGQIIYDFGAGIVNIFKAAAPAGQPLLDSMADIAARFREMTGSVQGQASLTKFFTDALPVIHEVNGLIGDIGRALVQSFSGENVGTTVAFVQSLREMVPAIQQMLGALSQSGPGLANLVSNLADLMTVLANSGALGAFTTTLNLVFQALTGLLSLPVVGTVAGWGLAFAGIGLALNKVTFGAFGAGLQAATGAVSTFITNAGGISAVLSSAGGGLASFGSSLASGVGSVVARIVPLLTGFVTVLRAVGVAMYTALGPVGLIIAAIGLLVAAAIYAYNNFEPFRNIVDTVAAALVSFGRTVVDKVVAGFHALMDALAPVGEALSNVWSGITSGVGTVVGVIQNVWNAFTTGVDIVAGIIDRIIQVITFPFQGLATFFSGIWQVIQGIFTGNLDQIIDGVVDIFLGLVQFFLGFPILAVTALQAFGPMLLDWISTAWNAVTTWVSTGFTATVAFFAALPGQILAAVAGFGQMLWGWITGALDLVANAIINGITAYVNFWVQLPGRVLGAVQVLVPLLLGWMANVWNTVISAVINGINVVADFFAQLPGRAVGAVSSLAGQLYAWASGALSSAGQAISAGINTVVSFFSGLPGRIMGAIGGIAGQMYSVGSDITNGIINGLGDVAGRVWAKISAGLSGLVGKAQSLLGIGSPSKVFRDQVGKPITQGVIAGIESMGPALSRSMQDLFVIPTISAPAVPTLATPTARSVPSPVDVSAALAAQVASIMATFSPQVTVKIGETELTELVDTRVETSTDSLAGDLMIGRRGQL